ncbi:tyrosine-protein phosphatase [Phototrophicus methaneseepsis]|uniref:Tyrosine-protein phosphatase n=1 Tax=Phototrophicus methaneseepsis TaxID=2710758 RepID=A0A7S8IFB9_9CHLR|nr:tyrosine-protein phosphatase [Phototrophicus methaneseepsis]QPC83339.1 tyrosine-protein phosphatase [Phototrophicus methaneseepsis]
MHDSFTELVIYPDDSTERILALEGAINFRDLGGYQTADGRQTRWGRVYRAASLSRLTDADLAHLASLGVRMVCDLRTHDEISSEPDLTPTGAVYKHMPLKQADGSDSGAGTYRTLLDDLANVEKSMTTSYLSHMVDDNAPLYGELLSLIADVENQPFIFHCTAGKDRTGIGSALLLLALGVPEPTVVADYSLSNLVANVFYESFKTMPLANEVDMDLLVPLMTAPPQRMEAVLQHLKDKYGSVERYLFDAAHITTNTLATLRETLLD